MRSALDTMADTRIVESGRKVGEDVEPGAAETDEIVRRRNLVARGIRECGRVFKLDVFQKIPPAWGVLFRRLLFFAGRDEIDVAVGAAHDLQPKLAAALGADFVVGGLGFLGLVRFRRVLLRLVVRLQRIDPPACGIQRHGGLPAFALHEKAQEALVPCRVAIDRIGDVRLREVGGQVANPEDGSGADIDQAGPEAQLASVPLRDRFRQDERDAAVDTDVDCGLVLAAALGADLVGIVVHVTSLVARRAGRAPISHPRSAPRPPRPRPGRCARARGAAPRPTPRPCAAPFGYSHYKNRRGSGWWPRPPVNSSGWRGLRPRLRLRTSR